MRLQINPGMLSLYCFILLLFSQSIWQRTRAPPILWAALTVNWSFSFTSQYITTYGKEQSQSLNENNLKKKIHDKLSF